VATVCAIVLNFNGWADTVECLESLLPGVQRLTTSVIVVDNASSDE
jgi:GT2 family glycosyltransferase